MQRRLGSRQRRLTGRGILRLAAGLLLLLALPGLTARLEERTSPRRHALAEWLAELQAPSGAIRNRTDAPDVTPYFANQAAAALTTVATPPVNGPERARADLDWYLAHLNRRDRYGLAGTVYDYHPGRPGPPSYDSADAYAATALSLARAYVAATGDWGWVRRNEEGLSTIGNLLVSLQDPDGLIRAGGPSDFRYLMDNTENYQGLTDWAWLLQGLGRQEGAAAVRHRAALLLTGIHEGLWDARYQEYRWASPPFGSAPDPNANLPNWSTWYPDVVAQIFPALHQVPESVGAGESLYQRLDLAFPDWTQGKTGDPYPWLAAGLAAWRLGQIDDVRALLHYAESRYPAVARPGAQGEGFLSPTWHSGEAAAELGLRTAMMAPGDVDLWQFLNGTY